MSNLDLTGLMSWCPQDYMLSGGSRAESISLPFPTSTGCLHCLVHGPFSHLQSPSLWPLLLSSQLLLWLQPSWLPLIRTLVAALGPPRQTRIIFLSQNPELVTPSKALFPEATYLHVPRIRIRTSLGVVLHPMTFSIPIPHSPLCCHSWPSSPSIPQSVSICCLREGQQNRKKYDLFFAF